MEKLAFSLLVGVAAAASPCFAYSVPAAFKILTPQDASALKIGTIDDPSKAFAAYAEGFDGVTARDVPKPNLLLTWRKLGIPVYAKVAFDGEGSAEFYRKRCGILPFAAGADGVILENDPKTLPPGWQKALEAAREDARLAGRLKDLAEKCRASTDYRIVIAGRHVLNWFAEHPLIRDDADMLRLETIGHVRHLEKLLGEQPCAADATLAKTEPNTLPFVPFKDREVTRVNVAVLGHNTKVAPGITLSPYRSQGLVIILSDAAPAWNPAGLPAGRDTFRVSLYLPERRGKGWERHDVVLSAPQKPTPRADTTYTDKMCNDIEERFRDAKHRAWEEPNRTWTTDYQRLHLPKTPYGPAVRQPEMKGWSLSFTVHFSDIVGQWPYAKEARRNVWYLAVDRMPDGSAGRAFRLQFPQGNAKTHNALCAWFDTGVTTDAWREDSRDLLQAWRATESERYFPFLETGVVHGFSRAENGLFWTRMVEPVYRRGKRSSETAWTDAKAPPPKYGKLPAAFQASFVENSDPYRHVYEIASALRRDFLLMRAKGETPPEPKADALSEEAENLKKPATMKMDEDETMSLDEEVL